MGTDRWTPAELAARSDLLQESIDDRDRDRVIAARGTGTEWSVQYRLNPKSGKQRWVQEAASRIHDVEGDLVVGTMLDITAQRTAQDTAADLSLTFEAVLNTPTFGVVILDDGGRITMANDAFAAIVGRTPDQVLHLPLATFNHPHDDHGTLYSDAVNADTDQAMTTRGELLHPDGTVRWVKIDVRRLPRPVGDGVAIVVVDDITALRRKTAELSHQARFDAVTGLLSRTSLRDALDVEITHSHRSHRSIGLLWIDIDRFKEVNDRHGHATGDVVLRSIAQHLAAAIREGEAVGRLGGDEFGVVLTGYDTPTALESAVERMLVALRQPILVDGVESVITSSVGVALHPEDGATPDELMRAADAAMYAAKAAGRDGFAYFQPSMTVAADHRRDLREEIAAAIAAHDFQMYYQPIVSAADGSVWGAEALVRWHRGDRILPAAEFIDFCEDSGQIRALGPLTLRLLASDLTTLRHAGRGDLPICVNMSVTQLQDRDLAHMLTQWPAPAGLRGLVIEVTESVFLPHHINAVALLQELTNLGAEVSVDDYGSGFSNLRLLKALSPRFIKLDRSFLPTHTAATTQAFNRTEQALLESAIQMAHALGATVVAEGIEDQGQQDLVTDLHADLLQGFNIATPMPMADLITWLSDREPPSTPQR